MSLPCFLVSSVQQKSTELTLQTRLCPGGVSVSSDHRFRRYIRPDKLDLLFLISHFLDLGAGGRLLFITSLFYLISDFLWTCPESIHIPIYKIHTHIYIYTYKKKHYTGVCTYMQVLRFPFSDGVFIHTS